MNAREIARSMTPDQVVSLVQFALDLAALPDEDEVTNMSDADAEEYGDTDGWSNDRAHSELMQAIDSARGLVIPNHPR